MSFIIVNDLIINLMAVVHAQYIPADEIEPCNLVLTMVSGKPLIFVDTAAFELWGRLGRNATPIERF